MKMLKVFLMASCLLAESVTMMAQEVMKASPVPQNEKGDFLLKGVNWYRISQWSDVNGRQKNIWDAERLGGENGLLLSQGESIDKESQYWAVSTDGRNYPADAARVIYNMAYGSNYLLTSQEPIQNYDKIFLTERGKLPENRATYNWNLYENDPGRGWVRMGTFYPQRFLSWADGNDGLKYISLYNYKSLSTQLYYELVPDPLHLEKRVKNTLKAENVVGGFTTEQLADLKRAWNTDTITRRYAKECLERLDRQPRIAMRTNGYYRIRSAYSANLYAAYDYSGKLVYKTGTTGRDVNDIFYFTTPSPAIAAPYKDFEGQLIALNVLSEIRGVDQFFRLEEGMQPASDPKKIHFLQTVPS